MYVYVFLFFIRILKEMYVLWLRKVSGGRGVDNLGIKEK